MTTGFLHTAPRAAKRFLQRQASFVGSSTSVGDLPGRVVLTYDDGPEPGGTDKILEVLADHQATATFFVLLTRVRRYPSLLADVLAAGHEVALHGIDHRALTPLPYREIRRRTADGRAELQDLTGRSIDWVRPPYGRQTLRSWHAVRSTGLEPVMWGPSAWDTIDTPQVRRISQATDSATSGSILLCHDGFASTQDCVDDGPAPDLDRGELATRILGTLGDKGLRACSLATALETGRPVRTAWFQR